MPSPPNADPPPPPPPPKPEPDIPPSINRKHKQPDSLSPPASSSAPLPPISSATPKKSTFRRLHPRQSPAQTPLPSSPLGPPQVQSRAPSSSSTITRQLDLSPPPPRSPPLPHSPPLRSRVPSINSAISDDQSHSSRPTPSHTPNTSLAVPFPSSSHHPLPFTSLLPPQPHPTSISPSPSPSVASPPSATSPLPSVPLRSSAPYRPGFQPKGVYRPRTDEFSQAHKAKHDATRIERTKLERRLEKLIHLHFPLQSSESKEAKKLAMERRRSSIFDLDLANLKNMGASDIWKGAVRSQALQGAKADIRGTLSRPPRFVPHPCLRI